MREKRGSLEFRYVISLSNARILMLKKKGYVIKFKCFEKFSTIEMGNVRNGQGESFNAR